MIRRGPDTAAQNRPGSAAKVSGQVVRVAPGQNADTLASRCEFRGRGGKSAEGENLGQLATLAQWLIGGWLFAVISLVLFKMLSGGIFVGGLLRLEPRAPFGLDRLQLVAVSLFFAAGYIVASLYRGPGQDMPNVPAPLLLILIGSNGTYLAVKYTALMRASGGGR
jgi:hypothetical protein